MSETAADAPADRTVKTHLGWAVAAAVLFFLPLGLVALVFAVQARDAVSAGDLDRAARKAKVAFRWVIAAIGVGVVLDLLLLAAFVLLGAFSS